MTQNMMRSICVTLLFSTALSAQGLRDYKGPAPTVKPAMRCKDLLALTSYDVSVVSARLVPAAGEVPEHCRVGLMVPPEINIEVNLPSAWNGRLYMFGNGGFAGESFEAAGRVNSRNRGLHGGFMTAATDTGHSALLEPAATFALNRQKLLDYGFRSLHVTAESAKSMARTYYGTGPAKSYYEGCSQGGRQGLTLAQRFPNDFDGIVAGSPALDQVGGMLSRAYWMNGLNRHPFPASKLGLLAQQVYEKCDAKDGLKDGLIDDPRRCEFKASRGLPRCESGDQPTCFTSDEIAALELIYGDVQSQGRRFFPGWPVGAEVAGPNGQSGWIGQEIPGANGPGAWTFYGLNFLQYMAPGAKADNIDTDAARVFAKFDIDKDPVRMEELRSIVDAKDADLSAFLHRGGRLIMYFGWADPQLNPRMGVEYYEQVLATMGDSTRGFFRLFMIPGMFHCGGGVGTSQFDAATPMIDWVESGTAPARIEAARVLNGKTVRTRPLCAYPEVARYKGSGSIDDTANFSCAKP